MGNPAPPHAWKEGQSGNPSGRKALPSHVARLREHSKVEVIKAISETFLLTRSELKERTARPEATMAELVVGSIMIKAIETGDPVRTQVLLNYVLGRPEPFSPPPENDDSDKPSVREVLKGVPSSILLEMVKNAAGSVSVQPEP